MAINGVTVGVEGYMALLVACLAKILNSLIGGRSANVSATFDPSRVRSRRTTPVAVETARLDLGSDCIGLFCRILPGDLRCRRVNPKAGVPQPSSGQRIAHRRELSPHRPTLGDTLS